MPMMLMPDWPSDPIMLLVAPPGEASEPIVLPMEPAEPIVLLREAGVPIVLLRVPGVPMILLRAVDCCGWVWGFG